jgi:hypothetical protein
MANTKITTNVIADGAITSAKLDSSSLSIPSTATATTQSAGDNSTKVATTAYVETAVSNLVSAAPAALDTLDELAAALGDDANFATTVTDSLALKAPLASPDFTGNVQVGTDSGDAFNSGALFRGQTTGAGYIQMKIGDTTSGGILIGDTTDDFRGGLISYGANHASFPNKTIIFANNEQAITASTSGVRLNGNSIARDPLHVHRASTGDCQIHMTNTSTGTSSSDGMTIFANSGGSGIWQRENTYFRIATNNAERFRLAAGGELTLKSDTDVIANFMNNSDNDHNFKIELNDASDLTVIRLNGKDGGDNKFVIGYGSTHSSTPNMLALKSNTTSGELGFFTNATQRMHITPTGEVGIGTDDPTFLLDIHNSSGGGVAKFSNGDNDNFQIKVVSDQIILDSRNVALTRITNQGNNAICIDSSARVGIGTDSPSNKLTVDAASTVLGGITVSGNAAPSMRITDTTNNHILYHIASDDLVKSGSSTNCKYEFMTNDTTKMIIDPSGRFAMGNTPSISTNYILSIDSDASGQAAGIHFTHGTKNLYLGYNSTTATDNAEMWNAANGYLRFGTNNIERVRLESGGLLTVKSTTVGGGGGQIALQPSNASTADDQDYGFISFRNNSETTLAQIKGISEGSGNNKSHLQFYTSDGSLGMRMRIRDNGTVQVIGALSKGSGSFEIEHPLESKKETHLLRHSFVEAPTCDNIYRGKVTLVNGSASVNLDEASGMSEGTFVLLNKNNQVVTTNESDWDNVKGIITGNTLNISCQNSDSTAEISWLVIGERHDDNIKTSPFTDSDGKLIVEPEKYENET